MKSALFAATAFLFLLLTVASRPGAAAGIEWETLIVESRRLFRAGDYDRALVVGRKALEVAGEKRRPRASLGGAQPH